MRIGVVRYSLDPAMGGGERYAWLLLRHLVAAGHSIDLFARVPPPEEHAGIRVHRVASARHPHALRPLWFTRAARRAVRRHARGLDAVLALSRHHPADVFRLGDPPHAAWLEQRNPSRWRRRLARLHPRHRVLLGLERRIFRGGARAFIANSELAKHAVVRACGAPAERVFVLRNPVDHERFHGGHAAAARELRRAEAVDADEVLLVFAAMNYRRKGLPAALEALAALRGDATLPRWRLLVAGPEAHRADLEASAETLGLADRVRFLGRRRDMEVLLAAADLLVLPTLFDPCANVVLEAMASGCIPVTTDTNGAAELIDDGRNGFVCGGPRDREGLVRALRRALRADRPVLARAAREAVRPLTWERHAAEVAALLERFGGRLRVAGAGPAG